MSEGIKNFIKDSGLTAEDFELLDLKDLDFESRSENEVKELIEVSKKRLLSLKEEKEKRVKHIAEIKATVEKIKKQYNYKKVFVVEVEDDNGGLPKVAYFRKPTRLDLKALSTHSDIYQFQEDAIQMLIISDYSHPDLCGAAISDDDVTAIAPYLDEMVAQKKTNFSVY